MIQFPLPPKLIPSVFTHPTFADQTPLRISYYFELEFLTEKGDRHIVKVPLNIEDNYPPRAMAPPPPIPIPSTRAISEVPLPYSDSSTSHASSPYPPGAAPAVPQPIPAPVLAQEPVVMRSPEPQPLWGINPSSQSGQALVIDEAPPLYQAPIAFQEPPQEYSGNHLYPQLPGLPAFVPSSDAFSFSAPPPFNPAFPQ